MSVLLSALLTASLLGAFSPPPSLDGGLLRVVTEKRGTDDGRAALFRFTYLIGASGFSVRKEVRRDGAEGFFERNVYSWSR